MTKIIIAGGGTGGHIFPAIAIANAIKQLQPAVEILFIGAKGKMEMEKVPQAGYPIQGLDIAGFNRSSLIKNISLPFKLIKSLLQVRKIIQQFKPQAVIGVGGYSSFPVLRYAQNKGIPTFIHESNSFAGKSNMILAKRATRIFVATDGMQKFFPATKIMVTGNPVRKNLVNNNINKEEALQHFGLKTDKKTILAIGGSLGARSINEALVNHLDELENNDLQLIWQTGKVKVEQYIQQAKRKSGIWAGEFINEMDKAYTAADVVISRSGAMAVTEMCIVKKPAVFVPFPFAAEDHQTANAANLVNRNAALMVKDSEAQEKLVQTVVQLINNGPLQQQLKENISTLAISNADEVIAQNVIEALKARAK